MSLNIRYLLGIALVTSWFLTNAYLAQFENKMFGDELQTSYGKFHTWSTPLMKKFSYTRSLKLPDPTFFTPFKYKIALGFSYLYFIASVGLLCGVRGFTYILILVHIVQSVLMDNPQVTTTQNDYDIKMRALMFDACLLAVLIMINGIRTKK